MSIKAKLCAATASALVLLAQTAMAQTITSYDLPTPLSSTSYSTPEPATSTFTNRTGAAAPWGSATLATFYAAPDRTIAQTLGRGYNPSNPCPASRPCNIYVAAALAGDRAQAGTQSGTVFVNMAPGVYSFANSEYNAPLILAPGNGGKSDGQVVTRVVYQTTPNTSGTAWFSGAARLVGGWATVGAGQIARCLPSGTPATTPGFWVGDPTLTTGARAPVLARQNIDKTQATITKDSTNVGLNFPIPGANSADLRNSLINENNLVLRYRINFGVGIVPLNYVSPNVFQPDDPAFFAATKPLIELYGGFTRLTPFELSGSLAFLDEPGEFAIEAASDACGGAPRLRYIPFDSTEQAALTTGSLPSYISRLPTVLKVSGFGAPTLDGSAYDTPQSLTALNTINSSSDCRSTDSQVCLPALDLVRNVEFYRVGFAHTSFDIQDPAQRAFQVVNNQNNVLQQEFYYNGIFDLGGGVAMIAPYRTDISSANAESYRTDIWFASAGRTNCTAPTDANFQDYFSSPRPACSGLGLNINAPDSRAYTGFAPAWTGMREAPIPTTIRVRTSERVSFFEIKVTDTATGAIAYDGGTQKAIVNGSDFFEIGGSGIRFGSGGVTDHHPLCRQYPRADDVIFPLVATAQQNRDLGFTFPYDCDVDQGQINGKWSGFITEDIEVSKNVITRPGRVFQGASGIAANFPRNARFVRNDIFEAPYSGIFVTAGLQYFDQAGLGSGRDAPPVQWRYNDGTQTRTFTLTNPSEARPVDPFTGQSFAGFRFQHAPPLWRYVHSSTAGGNIINLNYIDALTLLEDGGGIYVNGFQPFSEIRGNYMITPLQRRDRTFRTSKAVRIVDRNGGPVAIEENAAFANYGGVYLDEGAGGFTVTDNYAHNFRYGIYVSVLSKHQAFALLTQNNYSRFQYPPLTDEESNTRRIQEGGNAPFRTRLDRFIFDTQNPIDLVNTTNTGVDSCDRTLCGGNAGQPYLSNPTVQAEYVNLASPAEPAVVAIFNNAGSQRSGLSRATNYEDPPELGGLELPRE